MKFDNLIAGTILRNKRNGNLFKFLGFVDDEPNKAELLNLDTQETVKVLDRTYARWYTLEKLADAEEIEKAAEKILNGETKAEEKPVAPKVKAARPNVRKRPSRPLIKEEIPSESDKEEVEVKEARTSKNRQSSVKSEHVLAITKKLESMIAEAFPASRREVTQWYIKYRHQYAFVKIFQGKTKVKINILTRAMPPEVKEKLTRMVLPSYKWPLDGFFQIKSEEDLETAMELIQYSHKGAKG